MKKVLSSTNPESSKREIYEETNYKTTEINEFTQKNKVMLHLDQLSDGCRNKSLFLQLCSAPQNIKPLPGGNKLERTVQGVGLII